MWTRSVETVINGIRVRREEKSELKKGQRKRERDREREKKREYV